MQTTTLPNSAIQEATATPAIAESQEQPAKINKLGLFSLSFSHMTVDMQTSSLSVLIPMLYITFGLDYAAAALIVTLNSFTSSLIQPLFGIISDKRSLRVLLPFSTMLTAAGMVMIIFMPSYGLVLVAVIISGLGSAAFHPEGSRNANYVSGEKKASGLSIFFVGGNIGYALGPIFVTLLIGWLGKSGELFMLIPGILSATLLWRLLPLYTRQAALAQSRVRAKALNTPAAARRKIAGPLSILISIISVRAMVQTGLVTFIPLYFISLSQDNKGYAAFLLSVFLFAGAVGTLLGGRLGDRFDRKLVVGGSLIVVTPLLLLFLNSTGFVLVVSLAIVGATLMGASSLTVVMAQELLPNRVGLASGLTLGLAFGAGGLGAAALGKFADVSSIGHTMVVLAFLPLVVVALSTLMPSDKESKI